MHDVPRLLVDLAMVLGVGAVTSILCKWLRLPVVLGYVLAGLVVGPHVPIPLVADESNLKTLADLDVILLMFSIGMEFSLQKLFRAGPTALLMGSIQVGLAYFLGISAGHARGLEPGRGHSGLPLHPLGPMDSIPRPCPRDHPRHRMAADPGAGSLVQRGQSSS